MRRAADIKNLSLAARRGLAELDCQSFLYLSTLNSNNVLNVKLPVLMGVAARY